MARLVVRPSQLGQLQVVCEVDGEDGVGEAVAEAGVDAARVAVAGVAVELADEAVVANSAP